MKKILSLVIVATMFLGLLPLIAKADTYPAGPAIFPYGTTGNAAGVMPDYPSYHYDQYASWPGTNPKWNFSISISGVPDVQLVSVWLTISDPTKAKFTNYYDGFLCKQASWTPAGVTSMSDSYIEELVTFNAQANPYNATLLTEVFIIEVEGLDYTPGTYINITNCVVSGSSGLWLSGAQPDGHTVMITLPPPPPPTPPTAAFTISAPPHYENNNVTFNATTSTGGYDGANYTTITAWQWDFGDGGGPNNLTSVESHNYTTAGVYNVNLTVFAPIGPYGNASAYVDHDSVSHSVTIDVYVEWLGLVIDLYTDNIRYPDYWTEIIGNLSAYPSQYNGSQVDSYSPQDLVCLHAKLTYNGEPICNKEVAFDVWGPVVIGNGTRIHVTRQIFTDGDGIAEFCFRIPWPDTNAEGIIFGTWTAIAKASVAEVTISDWHWWNVHWMVQIVAEYDYSLTGVDKVTETQYLYIDYYVHNYALENRSFTFTAVLYDNLSVPVGYVTETRTVFPGDSAIFTVSIYVPEWAYVGPGMLYKNLFTKEPWLCGVCWSPEQSHVVTIFPTVPHIPPF